MKKILSVIQTIFTFFKTLIIHTYHARRCSKIDFFDYKKLTNPKFCSVNGFAATTHYGNHLAVGRLIHKRINFITDYIEHGVCFYTHPESAELLGYINRKGIKNVYTFSEQRAQLLQQYLTKYHLQRNVVAVGPYILGAPHFKSESELAALKKRYGKILLFFPQHSSESGLAQYSNDFIIKNIENRKKDFDTVFICMYWLDILTKPQFVSFYESKGYVVVTAGHRSDPRFLSRLKDLLTLADITMTNGLGTHIGYSICLNTPVCFINEKANQPATTKANDITAITNDFAKTFENGDGTITKEQRELVNRYYGKF